MTEQTRLTGDRLSEVGLDDSIAFFRYTEAIVGEASPWVNRISHQYLLWEEAQDEFHNYQEMYRTAEELARSIMSYSLWSMTITSNKYIFSRVMID